MNIQSCSPRRMFRAVSGHSNVLFQKSSVQSERISALNFVLKLIFVFKEHNISAVYIKTSITSYNCLISVNANDFMPFS